MTPRAAYLAGLAAIVAGISLLVTTPYAVAALLVVLAGCLALVSTSTAEAWRERRSSYTRRDKRGGKQ